MVNGSEPQINVVKLHGAKAACSIGLWPKWHVTGYPRAWCGYADIRSPAKVWDLTNSVANTELGKPNEVSGCGGLLVLFLRSEEHKSELQSLMSISYDVFCL